ncbi:MAG: hypothetical protein HFI69_11240 [Lachnospiraceae bacterium]|nr:hypothetical protein [Lachnospiraceae bacterium]
MATDIRQVLDYMEHALKLQIQANAERRSEKAAREEKEFKEKLMYAFTSKTELESKASAVKGSQDAVRRDQLMALMMAGF